MFDVVVRVDGEVYVYKVDGRHAIDVTDRTVSFEGKGDGSGFHPRQTFPLDNVIRWVRVG